MVNNYPRNRIARLNADGSLDSTFLDPNNGLSGANGAIQTMLVQSDGRILASGPPAQVRADPAVMTAYLGEELE